MTELWPSRSDTAGSSMPAANRWDPWECLSRWRLAPFGFGILSHLNRADTDAEIEFGFSGAPSGSAKIKSSSDVVGRTELVPENLLSFAVHLQRFHCGTGKHNQPGRLVLRLFEDQPGSRLR